MPPAQGFLAACIQAQGARHWYSLWQSPEYEPLRPTAALSGPYCDLSSTEAMNSISQKINPADARLTREGAPLLSVMRSSLRPCLARCLLPANRQRVKAPNKMPFVAASAACPRELRPGRSLTLLRAVLVGRCRLPIDQGLAAL